MVRPAVLCVFLCVLGACSGGSSGTDGPEVPAEAQMSVIPATIQATVTVGITGSASFTVQNPGGEPLTFQATTSDPWLSGLENLGNVDVSAGASRAVNLQVDCPATGQLAGSISVTGNAADNPSDTITVNIECVAPAIQIQITDAPGASNGAPGFDAQSTLEWGIASSWPAQPEVNYTVTSSDPGVVVINSSGTVGLTSSITNDLSYDCSTPASLTATLTISAGGSQASADWQVDCVAALEGNVTFDGAELYQGPLAAVIDEDLTITDYTDRIADRVAMFAFQLGHDSATIPEFTIDVVEPGGTTTLTPVLLGVQTPAETGTGRWASLYGLNVASAFMRTANTFDATMDPNNQIAETDEGDNAFSLDLAAFGLLQLPEFKSVFVPINAEGRVPAAIVTDEYLEATIDLFPVADYTSSVRGVYDYQGGAWDWQTALNEMSALWNAEGAADEFYHGIYRQPDNFSGGTTGIGFIGFPVAVSSSLDSPLGSDQTLAHEFGHNFGLSHAPGGCNETSVDPDYPYPGGGIGPFGGWLFSEARFIEPESGHFDVMTYCHPQFISDYHYQAVIDNYTVGQNIAPQSAVGVASGSIALSGSVDEYGVWTMTHMVATDRPPRPARSGPFVMVLHGIDGMELYRQALRPNRTDHGNFAVWAVRVPRPSLPVGAVRIWDASGNLILDADIAR